MLTLKHSNFHLYPSHRHGIDSGRLHLVPHQHEDDERHRWDAGVDLLRSIPQLLLLVRHAGALQQLPGQRGEWVHDVIGIQELYNINTAKQVSASVWMREWVSDSYQRVSGETQWRHCMFIRCDASQSWRHVINAANNKWMFSTLWSCIFVCRRVNRRRNRLRICTRTWLSTATATRWMDLISLIPAARVNKKKLEHTLWKTTRAIDLCRAGVSVWFFHKKLSNF